MDKLKQIRDKNPLLDFLAGFIPGVAEAQDIHDFTHAAKNKDFGGMALASLGLVTPFVNENQIVKGVKAADKLVDKIQDSRKFAKATDAPIYTKASAPKTLKLDSRDITEMHLNDGIDSEQIFNKELVSELGRRFDNADHGTAIRVGESLNEPNSGLSGKSASLFYTITRRWANQGKGGYFIPEGEPTMVQLNKIAQMRETPDGKKMGKFDQKFVDDLNKRIKSINELGYNFPEAQLEFLPNPLKPHHSQYEYFQKHPTVGKVLVPNIGFLKYNYGGKFKR